MKLREGNVLTGVCLSMGRLGTSGPMSFPGVGISGTRCLLGGISRGVGWVCPSGGYVQGSSMFRGGYPLPRHGTSDKGYTTEYGWQVIGMHPTGMLSC